MLKLEKRIRFNENDFDEDGNIRASSLLHSFQDIAAEHADILGVGREHLMERDWIWVLSKVKLKVYGSIEADKDVYKRQSFHRHERGEYRRQCAVVVRIRHGYSRSGDTYAGL